MRIHEESSGEQAGRGDRRRPGEARRVETGHRFSPSIELGLRKLSRSDNYHGPLALLETAGILLVTTLAGVYLLDLLPIFAAPVVLLPAWIIIGTRQRALATLLHEASHRALARNRRLNDFLGTVCSSWFIFQMGAPYKASHVYNHHPKLGHVLNDPDTEQYVRQGLLEANPVTFVRDNVIGMLLGLKALVNFPYLLRYRLLPADWRTMSRAHMAELAGFIIFWGVLLTLLTLAGWLDEFLVFWMLPYFTAFQATNWLIETAEHFPLVWLESSVVRATRNRQGNVIERFLTGAHGEGWHLVHHLRPAIPFWNLKKAHQLMLKDPAYAASVARYGGLFTRGHPGRPTILQAMADELGLLQSGQPETPQLNSAA
nr:fatty acid desaturase family protein [uncultured Hyphomonas sp.]